jgi:hypothetical protein
MRHHREHCASANDEGDQVIFNMLTTVTTDPLASRHLPHVECIPARRTSLS